MKTILLLFASNVFMTIAYLKEPIRWNYLVAFVLILAAVAVAMLPSGRV